VRFALYSGHDNTLSPFLSAFGVFDSVQPPMASSTSCSSFSPCVHFYDQQLLLGLIQTYISIPPSDFAGTLPRRQRQALGEVSLQWRGEGGQNHCHRWTTSNSSEHNVLRGCLGRGGTAQVSIGALPIRPVEGAVLRSHPHRLRERMRAPRGVKQRELDFLIYGLIRFSSRHLNRKAREDRWGRESC